MYFRNTPWCVQAPWYMSFGQKLKMGHLWEPAHTWRSWRCSPGHWDTSRWRNRRRSHTAPLHTHRSATHTHSHLWRRARRTYWYMLCWLLVISLFTIKSVQKSDMLGIFLSLNSLRRSCTDVVHGTQVGNQYCFAFMFWLLIHQWSIH